MPVFTVTALLFDCDGVLVDSLDAAAVAWNEWGTRWKPGFDFHRDVEHGRRLTDYVAELVGPEDAAEAAAELAALERDHAVDVHGIPGAAALLANLPAGRWAVVTSGTRDIATARLIAAGIPTPAVLVTADDVAKGKPSPDPYLLAAHQLDLPPSPTCEASPLTAPGYSSANPIQVHNTSRKANADNISRQYSGENPTLLN